jgi:HlyD family secretion protein
MRRLLGYWRTLAFILFIAAIVAMALWPDTIEVDLARATRGPLEVTIDEEGETRVRERFVISAPVAGRLQRIELEPGDRVVRGMVLARLVPAPPALLDARSRAELTSAAEAARAALGQAQAERARAQATLERSQAALKRQVELSRAGLIPPEELEAAQTAARTADDGRRAAEFSAARAQFELDSARARVQQPASGGAPVDIRSPVDGVVLKRLRESESVVPVGESLLEVGDPTALEIVSDLLSTDAVRVTAGQPVRLEQWGGSALLSGRVRRVEPSGFMKISALGVEEQRVNVIIDFADAAAAAKALGDNYRTEVRIVIWRADNVLRVPEAALFRQGDAWAAFGVENGRVRTRVVTLGQRNATEAEVTEGLGEGDEVVLHPPDTLTDGMRVTARAANP